LTKVAGAAGSKLVLGGTHDELRTDEFTYHALASETYWAINVGSMKLGSVTIN